MNLNKENYETPEAQILEISSEGTIMDMTNLEPIEPGDEHEW